MMDEGTTMEVREINILETNNTKTAPLVSDNTALSDELSAGDFQTKGPTLYARSKRTKKILTGIGIATTITAAGLLGGSLVSNSFLSVLPCVVSSAFTPAASSIHYVFTLTNNGELKAELSITKDGVAIAELDCSASGDYEGDFTDLMSGTLYTVSIDATNQVDYRKTILAYAVTTLTA
ncbi:MAG: hypothetical protein WCS90_02980 [Bacilli bacterium]